MPDFEKVSAAYGIPYLSAKTEEELEQIEIPSGFSIIDLHLPVNSLITPKTEMDRFIHDQFPYIEDELIEKLPFKYPAHPSELSGISNPTV